MDTPTQQTREKFEAECIRLELTEYLISKDPFRKTGEGEYYFDLIGELEQLWQSAHQCGREEGIAEAKAKVVEEKDYIYKNPCRGSSIAGACLKNVLKAIERI